MIVSVCFTNFGPYHLARLRALADRLNRSGDRLIAHELADQEVRYPWDRAEGGEPFTWTTLFPGRSVESISPDDCRKGMKLALDRDRPDVVAIVGYSRPESMAALGWALRAARPTILMSESQELDHPRAWWKEAIKRRRVRRFSAALVGGPRHREYLAKLGMPVARIALGYNAVDNAVFAERASAARLRPDFRSGLPARPYFIAVNRFVPEKNLDGLIRAYARYRESTPQADAWDLVLCGGGPREDQVSDAIEASGFASSIHRPGFLQGDELSRWLGGASSFVHPSRLEPWGLVVNEAAATGLPLLVSTRAGCAQTLVPDPDGTTGRRFDPDDPGEIAAALAWMAGLDDSERTAMGRKAAEVVARWGPERFASGTLEAIRVARSIKNRRPSISGTHKDLLTTRGLAR